MTTYERLLYKRELEKLRQELNAQTEKANSYEHALAYLAAHQTLEALAFDEAHRAGRPVPLHRPPLLSDLLGERAARKDEGA